MRLSSKTVPLKILLIALASAAAVVPFTAVWLLKMAQSELIRQTESELISQGVLITQVFRDRYLEKITNVGPPTEASQNSLRELIESDARDEEDHTPILPSLDLLEVPILEPAPDDPILPLVPDIQVTEVAKAVQPLVESITKSVLSGVRITDRNGIVIASSSTASLYRYMGGRPEFESAFSGRTTSLLRKRHWRKDPPPIESISRTSDWRVFVSMPIKINGQVIATVILSRTANSLDKVLYRYRQQIIAVGIAYLFLFLFLVFITSWLITKPLQALSRFSDNVIRGRLDEIERPTAKVQASEIASLDRDIRTMARELQSRNQYIRTFASHLTHEFKSPLTAIRGSLEIIHDHHDSLTPDQRETFVRNMNADLNRLTSLLGRLNELARIDAMTSRREITKVSLPKLKESIFDLQVTSLRFPPQDTIDSPIPVEMLEAIIRNLATNAYENGAGEVTVSLFTKESNEFSFLRVEDNGSGISETNLAKIFDPFFTTKRERGGTGLGLSIVKSIVQMHGCEIRVSSAPGQTAFEVFRSPEHSH